MSSPAPNIEQAIFHRAHEELHMRAASPGFREDHAWRLEAERLCRGFGIPPDGTLCPPALFAQPFGPRHVAIVQVASEPGAGLAFRLLAVARELYVGWIADPFLVAERFPPDMSLTGELPTLVWPAGPPAMTTLEHLQHVLQTGGSQTLLGAAQALVDGGRLVFERQAPATALVRDLWQLLPYSTRAELWPADFTYSNALGFDVLVAPSSAGLALDRYLTEDQAVDYPEGRYEFSLQYAVEHADRHELDRLLHRRTSRQTLRLVLFVLIGGALVYVAVSLLGRFL